MEQDDSIERDYAASFSLQQIFNRLIAGSEFKLAFSSRKEYDNLRTMLLRKFRKYKGMLSDLDVQSTATESYISCDWNKDLSEGRFQLITEAAKKRKPTSYFVKEL